MKSEDAIKQLTEILKSRGETRIKQAQDRIEGYGELTVTPRDYEADAKVVLEEAMIELAFEHAYGKLCDNFNHKFTAPAQPPPQPAPFGLNGAPMPMAPRAG